MACSLSGLGALNLGRFRDCRALCDLGFRARWVHEALGSADCCWVGLGSGLFTLGAGSWDLNIVWKGSSFVIMAQAFSDMRCFEGLSGFRKDSAPLACSAVSWRFDDELLGTCNFLQAGSIIWSFDA